MKNKKLQIFISSTYIDMKEERQTAVMAILEAGHIPVGMELFSGGDKKVFEAIKKWIDESDLFLLMLGGRYGSIDQEEQKSYIQLEYEYALQKNKPFFSLVMTEDALKRKLQLVNNDINQVYERKNTPKYDDFKAIVTQNMCSMCDDNKDIRSSTLSSLHRFEEREELVGWVSGSIFKEISSLKSENERIKSQLHESLTKILDITKHEHEKKPQLHLNIEEDLSYGNRKRGWFFLKPNIQNNGTSSARRAKITCELNNDYRFRYNEFQYEQANKQLSVNRNKSKLTWELEQDKVIFHEDSQDIYPWEISFVGENPTPLFLTVKLYADEMPTITQIFNFPSLLEQNSEILSFSNEKYIHFSKARQIVRAFHLKSQHDWEQLVRGRLNGKPSLPLEIPIYPEQYYSKDWRTWADWLGLNRDPNNDDEMIPLDKYSIRMIEIVNQKGVVTYGELTSIICKEFNVDGNNPLSRLMVLKHLGYYDFPVADNGGIGINTKITKTANSNKST